MKNKRVLFSFLLILFCACLVVVPLFDSAAAKEPLSQDIAVASNRVAKYSSQKRTTYKQMLRDEIMGKPSQRTFQDGDMLPVWIAIAVSAICVAGYVFMRIKAGAKVPIEPTATDEPPYGLSPLLMGYLLDRSLDPQDIGAMVLYWASHGHLTIVQREQEYWQMDGKYTLIKNSALDGTHPPYEIDAFEALFRIGNGNEVTSKQLSENYYKYLPKLKASLEVAAKDRVTLVSRQSKLFYTLCASLAAVAMICSVALSMNVGLIELLYRPVAFAYVASIPNYMLAKKKAVTTKGRQLILNILLSVVLFYGLFFYRDFPGQYIFYHWYSALLFVVGMLLSIFSFSLERVPKNYEQLLSLSLGFEHYLHTVKKEDIEAHLLHDPQYFFTLFPYAVMFQISPHAWMRRFADFTIEMPNWYQGVHSDTDASIANQLNAFQKYISSLMVSKGRSW